MTTIQIKAAKGRRIVYWIVTSLLVLGMLAGAVAQLLRLKANTDGIIHLGYPVYMLSILGAWKIAGVLVLLLPGFTLLKEWAYAGFFFLMTGAVISHLVSGDGFTGVIYQLIFVILIVLSWYLRPQNRKIAVY
ncbi:DoxX family protein [Niastella populi]|uniref:DoxX-like family protein n=1 Tax=Niastella populi TaxID=550983 RepID=A0A1V9FV55_9BACT|nr:DoxX family protein [Niastella populi]OQP62234.1 DoxX-like family protein [Niastella populi]